MPYIYILRCGDGSLYTGWTTDVARRMAAHSAGRGSRYTRSRLPVELAYCETCLTKSDALRREAEIKKMTRKEKLSLLEPCQ